MYVHRYAPGHRPGRPILKYKTQRSFEFFNLFVHIQHIRRKLKVSLSFIRYGAAVLEVHELLEVLEGCLIKTQRHFEFYK